MSSHPTDDELELIQDEIKSKKKVVDLKIRLAEKTRDAKEWEEAYGELQTNYHELLGAMLRIKWVVNGEYFGAEVREEIKDIIKELDI